MDSLPETAKGKWFAENLGGIREEECKFTSRATSEYNCVGFVVGDYQWWQPSGRRGHHWPEGLRLPKTGRSGIPSAKAYVTALKTAGFEECPIQTPDPEEGYEKAVVYHGVNGTFTHVAKILDRGTWTSKLGDYEDIEHPAPTTEMFGKYGRVYTYLRRDIKRAGEPLPDEYRL